MSETRIVLVLGAFPVVKREGNRFTLKLGGTTQMTVIAPPIADIRDGDLLTLYTEVLIAPAKGNG